jgi:hypothetical protein
MRKHIIDAIPAITGLAAAMLDAALQWAGAYHVSGATSALVLSLGIALGRGASVYLHSHAQPQATSAHAAPVVAPAGMTAPQQT